MNRKTLVSKTFIIVLVMIMLCAVTITCSKLDKDEPTKTMITEPQGPVVMDCSFPGGAPPLNQTAELVYAINIFSHDIKNMSFTINLPDAFQLINGDLTWAGDLKEGDIKEISVFIKAVQAGNHEIKVITHIDREANGGYGGTGNYSTYVTVAKDSAEWGTCPPWGQKGGYPVPVKQVDPTSSQ